MYLIYVNNTLPLALVVHEITRHLWAAYDINSNSTEGDLYYMSKRME